MSALIDKATLTFIKQLIDNNNRPWFTDNKPKYEEAKENIKQFSIALVEKLNKHDVIESYRVYRIYRDVRFSKDKTPYKDNIGVMVTRATEARRGGIYINIQPGNVFVGGGFWGPSPKDLKRIRKEFDIDADPMRKVLKAKKFKNNFDVMTGDAVKTAPKGYAKDHPNIDLLRYKQFLIGRNFTDKEALSPDFLVECDKTIKAMRPFFNVMTDILTTDENGESIL